MSEVVLTQAQIQTLRGYVRRGDTYGGWRYLTGLGDRYADNAAAIIGSSEDLNGLNLWMKKAVEHLWDDTAGREARLEKFDRVALQHFRQYVELIDRNHGRLPNTDEIEGSYYRAVTDNGIPSSAAIDLVINRILPDGSWGVGLGMEKERIEGNHPVSNPSGSTRDNAARLASSLAKGFGDAWKERPFSFQDRLNQDFAKLGIDYSIDGWKKIGGWAVGLSKDLANQISEKINQKKNNPSAGEAGNQTPQPGTSLPNFFPYPWQQPRDPEWKGVPFLPNPFVPDGYGGWFDNGHECLKPWGSMFDPYRRGQYHVYDPLALDLDGDGIETVSAAGFSGSLFDHNGNGIRTATGWISADDGLLVRDLNGNGIIDNGAELFGDHTKLADGSFAKHGYAALAELDSNGDGIVSAADAAFQTLRVWQDLNQDGISQANELRILEELGIQSLDVAYKGVNKNLGNGNTLAQQGSYTKTDGTTAQAGDLLLAADNLHSRFKDKVELTAEQAKAANLAGIGRLRDLREAAALSGDLANVLKAYSAADTKEAQLALLDSLIHEWAETDSEWGKKPPMHLSTGWTQTASGGVALTPSQVTRLKQNALVSLSDKAKAAIDAARDRIAVLDAYTGQDSGTLYYMSEEDVLNIVKVTNDTYENLAKNIYQSLLFQTRLQPYLNEIGFKLENNEFKLDFSGVQAAFKRIHAENPEKAFVDLSEFLAYGSEGLKQWTEGSVLWAQFYDAAARENRIDNLLAAVGETTLKNLGWKLGTAADDSLNGDSNNNILMGLSGNDKLYGNDGSDTLIGGAGNDYLEGGTQGDTYVFAKGHGQDAVYDYSYGVEGDDTVRFTDIASTEVKFRKNGSNLTVYGYNGDDSVTIKDFFSSSYAQIEKFEFSDKTLTLTQLTQDGFELHGTDADETIWGWNGKNIIYGEDGNDTIYGSSKEDVLNGGKGDDKLYGNDGSDTLIGGAGNDYLEGGTQGDTYVFAKGHGQDTVYDYSYGAEGDDTVRFTDIASTEVKFRKNGSNLTVFGYNGDDSVTIKDFFSSSYARIEHFEFQDGILSNPDFARFSQMANNLGQAMSVFGVQAVSSENSNAPADLSTKPILTLSPLS